jgi:hypothetical protein
MPKISSVPTKLAQRLTSTPIARKSLGEGCKTETERAKLVVRIWKEIPKPARKSQSEEEQRAYWAGVHDERKTQFEYDQQLRDAGLR